MYVFVNQIRTSQCLRLLSMRLRNVITKYYNKTGTTTMNSERRKIKVIKMHAEEKLEATLNIALALASVMLVSW